MALRLVEEDHSEKLRQADDEDAITSQFSLRNGGPLAVVYLFSSCLFLLDS